MLQYIDLVLRLFWI